MVAIDMPRVTLEICDVHNDNRTPGEPYTFAWVGERYEILLCDEHRTELERSLRPYLEAGSRIRGADSGRSAGGARRSGSGRGGSVALRVEDLSTEEREYARSIGWQGRRISNDVARQILERRQQG